MAPQKGLQNQEKLGQMGILGAICYNHRLYIRAEHFKSYVVSLFKIHRGEISGLANYQGHINFLEVAPLRKILLAAQVPPSLVPVTNEGEDQLRALFE